MLSVHANRKLLQQHVTERTGKTVIMKDIHNIATKAKKQQPATSHPSGSLQDIADFLQSKPNITTEYVINDNTLSGIFIQDKEMKKVFEMYPEVVLVDATHKTNNLDFPLYALVVIDGNGETEVVASMLMAQEDEESVSQLFRIFKANNPKWSEIKVVMTDKDMTERNVIKREIPNADLQICLFHVHRTFC